MNNKYPKKKRRGTKGNHKRTNDKRSGSRDNRSDDDVRDSNSQESRSGKLHPLNDISWYAKNPSLLAAAASIPYPYRPGMDIGSYFTDSGIPTHTYQMPGIATLMWAPAVGKAVGSPTDPIAIAAKEMYAKVRMAYSGTLAADPTDFIIYMMALDSIFTHIAQLKRLYRIISTYSPNNYLVPRTMLIACGVDENEVDNWLSEKLNLFAWINELIAYTRKLRCPAIMDILNRHYWMGDNVYTDAPTANSQMYAFFTNVGYKFSLIPDEEGIEIGGLIPIDLAYDRPFQVYQSIRNMIDELANSEDAYTISGYLMRAFEHVPAFEVEPLTLEEAFEPVYVEEVLSQIENITTLPSGIGYKPQNITQSGSRTGITMDYEFELLPNYTSSQIGAKDIYSGDMDTFQVTNLINIRNDAPTVTETVIATRLALAGVFHIVDDVVQADVDVGTEIPIRIQFYGTHLDNIEVSKPINYRNMLRILHTQTFIPDNITRSLDIQVNKELALMVASNFDWFPMCVATTINDAGKPTASFIYGDVHNLTLINRSDMENIHKVCVLSEFNAFGIE